MIELVVVIGVTAMLAALAVPSFKSMYDKRSVLAAADLLINDIRLTRAEAIRRTNTVSICSSSNGTSCSANASWASGWVVFVDSNSDGTLDAGEKLLKAQTAPTNVGSVASTNTANDRKFFTFQPTGWAKAADQTFILKPAGMAAGAYDKAQDACLVLSITGRVSLKTWGSNACP